MHHDVNNVVLQAVELFQDVHLGLNTSNVGVGSDDGHVLHFA